MFKYGKAFAGIAAIGLGIYGVKKYFFNKDKVGGNICAIGCIANTVSYYKMQIPSVNIQDIPSLNFVQSTIVDNFNNALIIGMSGAIITSIGFILKKASTGTKDSLIITGAVTLTTTGLICTTNIISFYINNKRIDSFSKRKLLYSKIQFKWTPSNIIMLILIGIAFGGVCKYAIERKYNNKASSNEQQK